MIQEKYFNSIYFFYKVKNFCFQLIQTGKISYKLLMLSKINHNKKMYQFFKSLVSEGKESENGHLFDLYNQQRSKIVCQTASKRSNQVQLPQRQNKDSFNDKISLLKSHLADETIKETSQFITFLSQITVDGERFKIFKICTQGQYIGNLMNEGLQILNPKCHLAICQKLKKDQIPQYKQTFSLEKLQNQSSMMEQKLEHQGKTKQKTKPQPLQCIVFELNFNQGSNFPVHVIHKCQLIPLFQFYASTLHTKQSQKVSAQEQLTLLMNSIDKMFDIQQMTLQLPKQRAQLHFIDQKRQETEEEMIKNVFKFKKHQDLLTVKIFLADRLKLLISLRKEDRRALIRESEEVGMIQQFIVEDQQVKQPFSAVEAHSPSLLLTPYYHDASNFQKLSQKPTFSSLKSLQPAELNLMQHQQLSSKPSFPSFAQPLSLVMNSEFEMSSLRQDQLVQNECGSFKNLMMDRNEVFNENQQEHGDIQEVNQASYKLKSQNEIADEIIHQRAKEDMKEQRGQDSEMDQKEIRLSEKGQQVVESDKEGSDQKMEQKMNQQTEPKVDQKVEEQMDVEQIQESVNQFEHKKKNQLQNQLTTINPHKSLSNLNQALQSQKLLSTYQTLEPQKLNFNTINQHQFPSSSFSSQSGDIANYKLDEENIDKNGYESGDECSSIKERIEKTQLNLKKEEIKEKEKLIQTKEKLLQSQTNNIQPISVISNQQIGKIISQQVKLKKVLKQSTQLNTMSHIEQQQPLTKTDFQQTTYTLIKNSSKHILCLQILKQQGKIFSQFDFENSQKQPIHLLQYNPLLLESQKSEHLRNHYKDQQFITCLHNVNEFQVSCDETRLLLYSTSQKLPTVVLEYDIKGQKFINKYNIPSLFTQLNNHECQLPLKQVKYPSNQTNHFFTLTNKEITLIPTLSNENQLIGKIFAYKNSYTNSKNLNKQFDCMTIHKNGTHLVVGVDGRFIKVFDLTKSKEAYRPNIKIINRGRFMSIKNNKRTLNISSGQTARKIKHIKKNYETKNLYQNNTKRLSPYDLFYLKAVNSFDLNDSSNIIGQQKPIQSMTSQSQSQPRITQINIIYHPTEQRTAQKIYCKLSNGGEYLIDCLQANRSSEKLNCWENRLRLDNRSFIHCVDQKEKEKLAEMNEKIKEAQLL